MEKSKRIIIIGGGLSGLTLAYLLSRRNIKSTIIEASSRLGGRIQTIQGELGTPLELGATWFSAMHLSLLSLLEELGLKKYPQFSKGLSLFQTKSFEPPQQFFVPESENPSYRIAGGTQTLIEALIQKLDPETISLSTSIKTVKEVGEKLLLEDSKGKQWNADLVVICMPPQLVASRIQFTPQLSEQSIQVMQNVQTWMAGSIKFVLEYAEPFWRNNGYSGMLYSHAGIVTEMYDHTNFEENKFGFTGFLNGGASNYSQEVRREFVLQQLVELLGEKATDPLTYSDKVWTDEFVVAGSPPILRPHQNNGHRVLQESYLNGKLLLAGTETDTEFAGYMEGAVRSAIKTANKF